MILAIMHSYIHEQAMMDITPNSSSVIIAGDKCILFLVLVVTVNLLHSWSFHIDALCSRSSSALGVIRPHCFHLPFKCKILFYKLYILPLFMYAAVSWCGLSSVLAERLEIHHRKLLRILFSLPPLYSSASLYVLAKLMLAHYRPTVKN